MRHLAILLVIVTIAAALAWDAAVEIAGNANTATWCAAFRDLNKTSGGLLGLCFIALGVHLLCIQWFPAAWGGPPR